MIDSSGRATRSELWDAGAVWGCPGFYSGGLRFDRR
jgi:hypothetical protein